MAVDLDEAALELAPLARRFERAEIEGAYVAWQIERTMPFNRAANVSSAIGLVIAIGCLLLFGTNIPTPVHAIVAILATTSIVLGLAYRGARPGKWVPVAVAAVNAAFGVGVAVIDVLYIDALELSAGAVAVVAFFGFTVNRTRPAFASLGVAIYLVWDGIALARGIAAGNLPGLRGGLEIGLLAVTFVSGMRAAMTIDADARQAFRHERIIEAQKATIVRERARNEELLKRELSHQVAERSRELGATLAVSGLSLDVQGLSPGERFAERYRIVGALGAGGMGAVYEVERLTDGASLALKVIAGAVSGASAARFAREAEIGARLDHRNLVSIVDVGVSAGMPFLVMDLVRGGSLEAQRPRFGDVEWALPIVRQIANGLAALHDAGVVHRDLKPANVLIADGIVKINDFGISRFGAPDESAKVDANAATMTPSMGARSSELTGTGVVMGTPLYMAPEAARSARALEASADVFALGIIAYEMLTGRPPFASPAFMLAMAEQPIPVPPPIDDPSVPAALRTIVIECLSGAPSKRPRVRAVLAAVPE